jgi:hypothetical protein
MGATWKPEKRTTLNYAEPTPPYDFGGDVAREKAELRQEVRKVVDPAETSGKAGIDMIASL